jgi:hypothetical protein
MGRERYATVDIDGRALELLLHVIKFATALLYAVAAILLIRRIARCA